MLLELILRFIDQIIRKKSKQTGDANLILNHIKSTLDRHLINIRSAFLEIYFTKVVCILIFANFKSVIYRYLDRTGKTRRRNKFIILQYICQKYLLKIIHKLNTKPKYKIIMKMWLLYFRNTIHL